MYLIQRLHIAHRVFVLGLLALTGMVVMGCLYVGQMRADQVFRNNEAQYRDLRRAIDDVDVEIQHAAISVERFLASPSDENARSFRTAISAASDGLQAIDPSLANGALQGHDALAGRIATYSAAFDAMFAASQELGFTPDQGLRGAMQSAVDKVEKLTLDVENADLKVSMLTLRKYEKDYMLWGDTAVLEAFRTELPTFKASLKKLYPPGAARMKVAEALDMYVAAFRLFAEGNLQDVKARGQLAAASGEVDAGLRQMTMQVNGALEAAQADMERVRTGNEQLAIAVAAIVATGILLTVWLVGRSISRPISQITAAMRRLAEGETEHSIAHLDQPNEIGSMVQAMEVFRQSAVERLRLEAEAEASRAAAAAERSRLQQQAEDQARERLEQATAGLAEGLRRLADGDLTVSLDAAFSVEFEGLREDLNLTVAGLRDLMSGIDAVSRAIDQGSRDINAEAVELAERSTAQAASLEESAAALDQIAQNVRHSAELSLEARTAVRSVNDRMAKTGELVAKAVEAMARIELSSTSIASIIGVIDEIAFQTNLLALNAGVEAARAGEAGKGFAVVAHEVRELAQRSANAAKEIKGLIKSSGDEVAGGARFVRETGAALGDIDREVQTIRQHMEAIASAASEQRAAIGSVNDAVASMDRVTQQNAALVDRNQVAVAGLEDQASRLRALVGMFHLGDDNVSAGKGGYRDRAA
ncbi:methyl-accepting chemotaxis protein [Rhizobium wuzhouense]|uniref:Methyl-accepting chemotaxis protein n=2 Tax=Rhizobium wuzhouense TaxID=1986026 RepID=A0ABX5NN52_9HYPH|nr:methyl-accepting chemotaxis protein [Rhizobium wuzhouense]